MRVLAVIAINAIPDVQEQYFAHMTRRMTAARSVGIVDSWAREVGLALARCRQHREPEPEPLYMQRQREQYAQYRASGGTLSYDEWIDAQLRDP